jgi:hypothetical protein
MTSERARPGDAAADACGVTREGAVLRRTAAGWSVGDEDLPDLTCAMVLADLIAAELPESDPEPSGRPAAAGADAAGSDKSASGGKPATGGGKPATGGGKPATGGKAGTTAVTAATADAGPASTTAVTAATADAGPAGTGAAAAASTGAAGEAGAGDDGAHEEARRLRITVSQLERALAVRIRVEQAIGVLAERHRIRPRQAFEQLRAVARGRGQRVIDIAGDVIASATNPLLPLPEELSRPSMAPRQRAGSRRRAREPQ